jgi:hypothetical protein
MPLINIYTLYSTCKKLNDMLFLIEKNYHLIPYILDFLIKKIQKKLFGYMTSVNQKYLNILAQIVDTA